MHFHKAWVLFMIHDSIAMHVTQKECPEKQKAIFGHLFELLPSQPHPTTFNGKQQESGTPLEPGRGAVIRTRSGSIITSA